MKVKFCEWIWTFTGSLLLCRKLLRVSGVLRRLFNPVKQHKQPRVVFKRLDGVNDLIRLLSLMSHGRKQPEHFSHAAAPHLRGFLHFFGQTFTGNKRLHQLNFPRDIRIKL